MNKLEERIDMKSNGLKKSKSLRRLLMSSAHININKELSGKIGINPTILLSELLSRMDYFESQNLLEEGDWFYNSVENLKQGTTLSEYEQRMGVKILVRFDLIECKIKHMPHKRYFRIKEENIFELMDL